jgi:hypothetical protein
MTACHDYNEGQKEDQKFMFHIGGHRFDCGISSKAAFRADATNATFRKPLCGLGR